MTFPRAYPACEHRPNAMLINTTPCQTCIAFGLEMIKHQTSWKIITICGSMRYFQQMLTAAEVFSERGYIVLMPFVSFVGEEQTSEQKTMLDKMHRAKIDLSEGIVVVGEHKGTSTRSEIDYAREQKKHVLILDSSADDTMNPPCLGDCELRIIE